MQIQHTIDVSVHGGAIAVDFREFAPSLDAPKARLTLQRHWRELIDTRDKMVIDELMKLGWTPPPAPAPTPSDVGDERGQACLSKAERTTTFSSLAVREFILQYLTANGASSSERLVDAAKGAGHVPHDDRAFGPIIASMARQSLIYQAGQCAREKGHGTAGGRLWAIARADL